MDGKKTVVRLYREWVDNIVDMCRAVLQEISHCVRDTNKWNQIVTRRQIPTPVEPRDPVISDFTTR